MKFLTTKDFNFQNFFDIFNTVMADNGLSRFAGEEESRMVHKLTEHMLEVNKSMNLTAIKEERAVILRHYADSLTVASFLPQNASVIDVGCGAGFPCLPLAICRPDLRLTALDSTEKRIRYVAETAQMLGRTNLTVTKNGFGALPVQRVGMEEACAILRRAYEGGINYFDTARPYHGGASETVVIAESELGNEKTVSAVTEAATIYIPLGDLVDFDKEIARLQKEIDNLQKEIARAEGKLNNQGFVAKAPAQVIEGERAKLAKYRENLDGVVSALEKMMK